jgi:hypothetical protein
MHENNMACASDLVLNRVAFTEDSRPLAALSQTGLERLFHSWRGVSGRRYICSVYDVDQPPAFDSSRAVVIAVRRDAAMEASIAFVFQPETLAEGAEDSLGLWTLRARQCGAREWHVHLLAASADERKLAARDLSASARRDGVRIRPTSQAPVAASLMPPLAAPAENRLAS